MQLEWWLAGLAIFGLGFLLGYLARALKSRRRRRWSTWGGAREMRHAGILRQSAREEDRSTTPRDSLRCAADAPPVSVSELGGPEEKGLSGRRNSARPNESREKVRDGNIVDVPTTKASV